MSDPVLTVRNLVKRYYDLSVTNDVSFSLLPGDRHALIGPNGAGKSTLIHQLSGVLRPDGGRIFLGGQDVTNASARRRVALGLGRTFQITNLFQRLSVFHNIYLALSERTGVSRNLLRPASRNKTLLDEGEAIAATFNLTRCLAERVSEISYGQQRLLEIAVAMALRPKVLLLDEPAAGLPNSEIRGVLDGLALLPRETAILLIEHDMLIVREFAASVSVLVEGRIVMTGSPSQVLESDMIRAVYLGQSRRGAR